MTQGQGGVTRAELQGVAEKLARFCEGLNERERQVFTAIMQRARAGGGEVSGYDDSGPGNAPSLDLNDFPWTTVLSVGGTGNTGRAGYDARLDRPR